MNTAEYGEAERGSACGLTGSRTERCVAAGGWRGLDGDCVAVVEAVRAE